MFLSMLLFLMWSFGMKTFLLSVSPVTSRKHEFLLSCIDPVGSWFDVVG